jgi:alkylation response protein AidB-like acyl-CoA dehydrogenase
VDFEYSPEEKTFRAQVKQFLADNHDPEVMDPTREGMAQLVDTPGRRSFMKKLSQRGWIGMSWPKEYGGSDAPGMFEYILNEELATVGAPLIGKGVGIVGKTIMRHGNDRLKTEFLPKILNAEIEFAIGYSEPNAGSDLAALSLKCTKTDGGWILNGQKRFTTSAHFADWYWVAARTDADAPKHKGISLFLVPMNSKGIEVVNMPCLAGERTNEVFLDDVFVGDEYVVGEVNKGFYYISEALDFERFTLFTVSAFMKKYEALRTYLRTATRDGKPMRDDPEVRRVVARLATRMEACKMHCLRVISKAARGEVPNIEAAMFKLWLSMTAQEVAEAFITLAGPDGVLRRGTEHAPIDGRFENYYQYSVLETVGAGTSEVQRNIIARRALGLPVQN